MSTLCTLRYHLAHRAQCEHCYCFSHFFVFLQVSKGSNKLLLATWRSDEIRRRKTAGNIADELLCCLWRRAEKPVNMIHHLAGGGYNSTGYIALLHPKNLASRQPEYLAQHRLLTFLGNSWLSQGQRGPERRHPRLSRVEKGSL